MCSDLPFSCQTIHTSPSFCWNSTRASRIPDIRSHAHSFPRDFWQGRTFVLTSKKHPGHLCSHQMTTPDIRAHIKWPPRTFVLISNDHPGHSCSYQLHFIYLFFTCLSPPTNRLKFFKKKYKGAGKGLENIYFINIQTNDWRAVNQMHYEMFYTHTDTLFIHWSWCSVQPHINFINVFPCAKNKHLCR